MEIPYHPAPRFARAPAAGFAGVERLFPYEYPAPDIAGWLRAHALGVNPRQRLAGNDARGFFAALDDLLVTGPTRTNANDFRTLLVGLQ